MIVEIEIPDEECHALDIYAPEELVDELHMLWDVHLSLTTDKTEEPTSD